MSADRVGVRQRMINRNMDWGANALSAPTTPGNRVHVVDKSKVDPKRLRAAEGMEAMFLDYMMKVMRQTVPKNEMDLESPATEIYRSMLDTETAQKAARSGGIGLADQIIAYLASERYNLPKGQTAPAPVHGVKPANGPTTSPAARPTGGTDAGQPDGN